MGLTSWWMAQPRTHAFSHAPLCMNTSGCLASPQAHSLFQAHSHSLGSAATGDGACCGLQRRAARAAAQPGGAEERAGAAGRLQRARGAAWLLASCVPAGLLACPAALLHGDPATYTNVGKLAEAAYLLTRLHLSTTKQALTLFRSSTSLPLLPLPAGRCCGGAAGRRCAHQAPTAAAGPGAAGTAGGAAADQPDALGAGAAGPGSQLEQGGLLSWPCMAAQPCSTAGHLQTAGSSCSEEQPRLQLR